MLSILPRALASFQALRAGTPALLERYAENERRDPRALEALQIERLKHVLVHASERVPFWRRRLARFGVRPEALRSIRDLAPLPPLTERDLLDFGDELLTDGSRQPDWFQTRAMEDGRDGLGLSYCLDERARRERLADELRHVTWTGLDWRAPRAVLAGRAEHGGTLEGAGGRLRGGLKRGVWMNAGNVRAEAADFNTRAARAEAELLVGAPSVLDRWLDEAPEPRFRPRVVQSWGESLSRARRERITRAVGAPVFDAYRTRETGEAAHECGEHAGLHVSMERVIFEFVRNGEPVGDGEDGEILVTVLDNLAEPLLRYRMGDVGCRVPEPVCACGRTSERILLTDGRVDELVTTPSGRRVHADWIEWLLEGCPGVLEWRVRQDRPAELLFDLVRGEDFDDRVSEHIRREVRSLDPDLAVSLHFVNAVPRRADGRARPVVSRVPLSWPNPS